MVIRHILQYLLDHPEAKDTREGILRWWLPGGISAWEEEAVQEALDVLVAKCWLRQRPLTACQQLYGVNKEKLEEIQVFLSECASEEEGTGE